jgi:Flp pilus assembly pilin Flp
MTTLLNVLRSLLRQDDGQDLLEYAMLIALISIFAMGAVSTVGETINGVFWEAISAATDNL